MALEWLNRFQHSTETVQRRFRHALRAIHNFRNILVKPDENARELPHDLRVNRKYYPWFKSIFNRCSISIFSPKRATVHPPATSLSIKAFPIFFEVATVLY